MPTDAPAQNRFIILADQRTGGTFLCTSLNRHPKITCKGEIFLNPWPFSLGYHEFKAALQPSGANHQNFVPEYLAHVCKPATRKQAFGFRLTYDQEQEFPEILEWSLTHKVKIIHLYRTNKLKQFLSMKVAQATGVFHLTKPRLSPAKIILDPHTLVSNLVTLENIQEHVTNKLVRHAKLAISYEDICKSFNGSMSKILHFAGIDSASNKSQLPIPSNLKKINSEDLSIHISNYSEIALLLKKNKLDHYLSI